MAFNSSGTFNRVHNWVSDRNALIKIVASRHDEEDDGFATGLSNCVCKDGQTGTTARIPFAFGIGTADGTVAAPAINFTSDTNSGIYRIGADNIGIGVNGAKVLDISTGGLAVTGALSSTGAFSSGAYTVTSNSANAFAVGPNGTTNPSFRVNASAGSAATGIDIAAEPAGSGVFISVSSSGSNEPLYLDAKGSSPIVLAATSTGAVLARSFQVTGSAISTANPGVEITYGFTGGAGGVGAFDRTLAAYKDLQIYGANVNVNISGTIRGAWSSTGLAITGVLSATSDFAIATSKFTVAASTGNTLVAGTLSVTSDVAVNTNKFTVAASTGNTLVAGTLNVTGATTLSSALTYGGVTLSNAVTGTGNMVLSAGPTITGTLAAATITAAGTITVTSTSASALTVGANGATNPVLQIDASTASVLAGLKITGAASGSGVALAAIGGTNEPLTLDGKGSGKVSIATVSTGTAIVGTSLQVRGLVSAGTGAGVEVGYDGSVGYIFAMDRGGGNAYLPITFSGSTVALRIGSTAKYSIDASGNAVAAGNLNVTGTATHTGQLTANNSAGIVGRNTVKAFGHVVNDALAAGSFNVSSMSDDGATHTINFTAAMTTTTYTVVISGDSTNADEKLIHSPFTQATGSFQVKAYAADVGTGAEPDSYQFMVLENA